MTGNIRVLVVSALIGAPLFAAKFWEKKPYEQWSQEEALKVLEDSPWGKVQKVHSSNSPPPGIASPGPDTTPRDKGGGDRESSPLNRRRLFNIRFQSAKPVRMALARLSLLYRRRDHRQAAELVQRRPFGDQYIVVAVSGSQGENHRRELDQANLRQLGTHTYLALKASGRRIELERYVPPREAGGREAFFLFPRTRGRQRSGDAQGEGDPVCFSVGLAHQTGPQVQAKKHGLRRNPGVLVRFSAAATSA